MDERGVSEAGGRRLGLFRGLGFLEGEGDGLGLGFQFLRLG